jgi:2',3'-cyclic-nucleotide 2'-phosphodiesterase (5'-nucleotidase family)
MLSGFLLFALPWQTSVRAISTTDTKHITIICTNDTLGVFEPCGCGGQNVGGLIRRATYIKNILTENPAAIVIESGNLTSPVSVPPPADQIDTVAEVMKLMGYTAVGVGTIDTRLGEKYFEALSEKGLLVIHSDIKKHEGTMPYIIKEVDGVKIGIVSFGAVPAGEENNYVLFKERYRTFIEARQKSDILILLDQGRVVTADWLSKNAKHFGSPDIVLPGAERSDLPDPEQVGQTMILPTSTQGRYVGRVDIEWDGTIRKATYSRTLISKDIADDPDTVRLVKEYTERARLAASQSPVDSIKYINYQSCSACHTKETEQWRGTRHANALNTLIAKGKVIPDCLPCHSEMNRRTGGITLGGDNIGGVECSSCHIDVLPHGADYEAKGDTAAIRTACQNCHTKDKSPNFNPDAAFESIKHTQPKP